MNKQYEQVMALIIKASREGTQNVAMGTKHFSVTYTFQNNHLELTLNDKPWTQESMERIPEAEFQRFAMEVIINYLSSQIRTGKTVSDELIETFCKL